MLVRIYLKRTMVYMETFIRLNLVYDYINYQIHYSLGLLSGKTLNLTNQRICKADLVINQTYRHCHLAAGIKHNLRPIRKILNCFSSMKHLFFYISFINYISVYEVSFDLIFHGLFEAQLFDSDIQTCSFNPTQRKYCIEQRSIHCTGSIQFLGTSDHFYLNIPRVIYSPAL